MNNKANQNDAIIRYTRLVDSTGLAILLIGIFIAFLWIKVWPFYAERELQVEAVMDYGKVVKDLSNCASYIHQLDIALAALINANDALIRENIQLKEKLNELLRSLQERRENIKPSRLIST